MAYQSVFKRYELKYLITPAQKSLILSAMAPHMELDRYGRTTIRNLYFDTPDYRLIRRSIEKPIYKEKLRLRSYHRTGPGGPVFVELKKKYDHIVYKRRLSMPMTEAMDWLQGQTPCPRPQQISREIDYFMSFYPGLEPRVYLSYEREAYACPDSDFRVTFDENVLCRRDGLSLDAQPGGTPLLPEGKILMEIKCSGGIPLWMTSVLTRERIFRTSYSKYGTAYQTMIFKGDNIYA